MIFIVVKYQAKPEVADKWMEAVTPFTEAVRAEPGNLWFDWHRSVTDPNVFVLLEAFKDQDAAVAHVQAPHFAEGLTTMRPLIAATPEIVNTTIDHDGWYEMGELKLD